jgi:hypothetical protein
LSKKSLDKVGTFLHLLDVRIKDDETSPLTPNENEQREN